MNNELFRKESLDRLSSPEQMRDYMRVTSPRLWMMLAALIALLAGFLIYASTTTMENTVTVQSDLYGSLFISYVQDTQASLFSVGMPIRVAGEKGTVTDVTETSQLKLDLKMDDGSVLPDGDYRLFLDGPEVRNVDVAAAGAGDGDGEESEEPEFFLYIRDGKTFCFNDTSIREGFAANQRVRIDGKLGTVTSSEPGALVILFMELDDDSAPLPRGSYQVEIVTESTTPLSFLMN